MVRVAPRERSKTTQAKTTDESSSSAPVFPPPGSDTGSSAVINVTIVVAVVIAVVVTVCITAGVMVIPAFVVLMVECLLLLWFSGRIVSGSKSNTRVV